jgi:hypothetical protein
MKLPSPGFPYFGLIRSKKAVFSDSYPPLLYWQNPLHKSLPYSDIVLYTTSGFSHIFFNCFLYVKDVLAEVAYFLAK